MKYRIKDEKFRKAAITLFGDLAKEFDYGSNLTAIEVSLSPLHWINNELSCIFHPLTNELEIEPIQELAEGWHPFPETKPQKAGKYLVALKCNDDGEKNVVDAANFAENCFDAWHSDSDIFAWKELPKLWKGN